MSFFLFCFSNLALKPSFKNILFEVNHKIEELDHEKMVSKSNNFYKL